MGKYSDMAAERQKEKVGEAAAEKKRRAESRAAYEASGAARQIASEKKKKPKPETIAKPSAGSTKGAAKDALMREMGVKGSMFDRQTTDSNN